MIMSNLDYDRHESCTCSLASLFSHLIPITVTVMECSKSLSLLMLSCDLDLNASNAMSSIKTRLLMVLYQSSCKTATNMSTIHHLDLLSYLYHPFLCSYPLPAKSLSTY